MTPATYNDIQSLLIHYPTLTIGEYANMFNCSTIEKTKSEISKKLEIQVLTYQSAIKEIEKEEIEYQRKRKAKRHDRIATEKQYGNLRISGITQSTIRPTYTTL